MAELQQRFVLAHDLPNIITGYDLHTELFSARRVYPGFTREGAGGSMGLSHRTDRANRVYTRYRIERVTTELTPTEAARCNDSPYRSAATIATIGAGFIHDTLDTEFLPRDRTAVDLERPPRSCR